METLEVVDFHNHFVGPGFPLATLAGVPQGQRVFWEAVNGRLSAPEALFASLEEAGVSARVINSPLEFLHDGEGKVPPGTVERINDSAVVQEKSVPARLQAMFDEFGLGADERRGIAGQNALRLLKASGS